MWIKDDKNIRSFHSTFQEGLINHWNASPVPVNLTLVFKMNNAAPHYSLSKTCLHFYNLPPFIFSSLSLWWKAVINVHLQEDVICYLVLSYYSVIMNYYLTMQKKPLIYWKQNHFATTDVYIFLSISKTKCSGCFSMHAILKIFAFCRKREINGRLSFNVFVEISRMVCNICW